MNHDHAFETFLDPPREFGLIPFWFWNDDLDEDELIRQLRAFHDAGFGGVMPSARIGLSRRVGYLTDEYFRLMRRVVEEAAALDMKVILYDEGTYPSGSACGAVVAENPDYASRALRLYEHDLEGPHVGFWRPNTGRALLDRHIGTVLGHISAAGTIDPGSVRLLTPHAHTIFKIDVPAGSWKVMSVWDTASGGVIRGAYPDQEDGHATAPASGDILNPEAVGCFIRLTHDRYYEELADHFGTTIIAMFTDEPSVTGRGASRRGGRIKPYTPGLPEWLEAKWGENPRTWLPALWVDYGEGTDRFRQRYADAIQDRLSEVFYTAQSEWCEKHSIALTGHPADSNDLTSLRQFQMPGQDMVWRYVEPDRPTAVEGAHSIAAKAATSGARLSNRRRILTEVCGAYGWRLTLDEVKWLFDWHLVRGNNLINPHAVFYSIRDRRAWESEPDLALHNIWWPYFGLIANYARRLCWLLTDGEHVCDVAILGNGNDLPWQAARQLYQRQIDFLYLDDRAVADSTVGDGRMRVGSQQYRVVIIDGELQLSTEAGEKLDAFTASGGTVIHYDEEMSLPAKIGHTITSDIVLSPPNPDLRFIHYRKAGLEFYLLVNEGEHRIKGELDLALSGHAEQWDPLTGEKREVSGESADEGMTIELELERRGSLIIAIDPSATFGCAPAERTNLEAQAIVETDWTVRAPDGSVVFEGIGDWSRQEGWELFSGTLSYCAELVVPKTGEAWLDLGIVGDIAEIILDESPIGTRMWSPYRLRLGVLEAGPHDLEVRVTNSMANAYEGMQLPSGLMGPVTLQVRKSRQ